CSGATNCAAREGRPGDELLESRPLVDQFGQWMRAEWPGKARDLTHLTREWAAESNALRPGYFGLTSTADRRRRRSARLQCDVKMARAWLQPCRSPGERWVRASS
ncbi:MAG: hypothetical protein ACJ74Z_07495, partial [Bryobacteraceae bacterium]